MKDLESLTKIELIAEIEALRKMQPSMLEDIEESKKTVQYINLSDNYLKSIINNIGDPVFVKDSESRLLLVNDAFCLIFGLSRERIIGKTLAEDVPISERESFLKIDNQVLTDGIESIVEESLTVRGRKTKIISTRKSRYIDDEGNTFLIGIIHDISEQKKAENELSKSLDREKLLADIVRDSFIGIAIGYPDGRLGMCNIAYQKITGYNEEELKNVDWNTVLTPPEWHDLESAKLQQLHKTKKPIKYEKEYIKKDGSRVPIELIVNPNFNINGKLEYYIGFVIDITERKENERKLLESNELFRMAFNQQFQFMAVLSPKGKVIKINELPLKVQGGKAEDIIGKYFWTIPTWENNPEWQNIIKKQVFQAAGMDTTLRTEDVFTTTEGEVHTALAAYTAIRNHEQEVCYILVQATDITERKKIENELKAYQEDLENLVKERTKKLEEKNEELEKFNELFIDREFRIKELKERIKQLENQ